MLQVPWGIMALKCMWYREFNNRKFQPGTLFNIVLLPPRALSS